MNIQEAYDQWSVQYDGNANRTRDLEAQALRRTLSEMRPARVLGIGCGTGKNTGWLAERCVDLTAVDLSAGMLDVARAKVTAPHVSFHQADILGPWEFAKGPYDLVTFSLMLEHVQDLGPTFAQAADVLRPGGLVYVGELHPFKQYSGTKARFETDTGTQEVTCFEHHISDFVKAATAAHLKLDDLQEFFDAENPGAPPRVLVLLLRK